MNKVILMGRLTTSPEVRYRQNGENSTVVARYTLAVDRRQRQQEGKKSADFIQCVMWGKAAEWAEKWLTKGTKIIITGEIRTGSYTNKDGQKVYTTEVYVLDQEFAESKAAAERKNVDNVDSSGFMTIPDGLEEELPFNYEVR